MRLLDANQFLKLGFGEDGNADEAIIDGCCPRKYAGIESLHARPRS